MMIVLPEVKAGAAKTKTEMPCVAGALKGSPSNPSIRYGAGKS